jgi:hypothetical protein
MERLQRFGAGFPAPIKLLGPILANLAEHLV